MFQSLNRLEQHPGQDVKLPNINNPYKEENNMIVNLTPNKATLEQLADGVVDLPDEAFEDLVRHHTFTELPEEQDMWFRTSEIINLAKAAYPEHTKAMIGGAPWFITPLICALNCANITPVFSCYVEPNLLINLEKPSNKHIGFYTAG